MGVKFNPFTSKLDIVDSPSGEFSDIELALGTQTAPSLSFTGDPNTGIYSPGADQVALTTAGSERLRLTSDGTVGIGTASPGNLLELGTSTPNIGLNATTLSYTPFGLRFQAAGTTYSAITQSVGSGELAIKAGQPGQNSYFITFSTNDGTERARIDSSGRLLVGTSSNLSASGNRYLQVSNSQPFVIFHHNANNPTANTTLAGLEYGGQAGGSYVPGAFIRAQADGDWGSGDAPTRLVFSTTADSASSPTERMRITQDGTVFIGGTANAFNARFVVIGGSTVGDCQAGFGGTNGGSSTFYHADAAGANAADTVAKFLKVNSTSRSINAAGTVNASGADYAEYMVKAGDFTLGKGDVCGVTANGQLTNNFANAVSFVVKSTNPSYVGGDTWGSEDILGPKPDAEDTEALAQWKLDLEAARQKVDRIAFAGQVPVNVIGATPGQYIVPVEDNGGISGIAKNETDLTLAEYMRAVGKVIAIEDDGRARIIVKVA
jgi:hypothetical protein